MSLFANVYTLPVWVAASAYYFYMHSLRLNDTYERVLALVFFCLATPLEASRLYLGYSGNLRERVDISIQNSFDSSDFYLFILQLFYIFLNSLYRYQISLDF